MNTLLDDLLVGAVLLISLGYAVIKLGPRTFRKRVFEVLSRLLAATPAFLGLKRLAHRLAVAPGKTQGACGGCDSCGSESSSAPPQSSEINVPVSRIGRRA
jgi:hypothetical protein